MGWKTKGVYKNDAFPFVVEYYARKRLAALGYTSPIDNLDCITAEALLHVDAEVAGMEAEMQAKAFKKKR